MPLDQHESPDRPRFTPEAVIALKETLEDEQTMTDVCDFMADLIGKRNQEASGEAPTDEWRTSMAAIIAEGLVYITTELPEDEWIDRFYPPEVIAGALHGVELQASAAEGQHG